MATGIRKCFSCKRHDY